MKDFKIRSNSDASITGGEINISGDGGLRAHNGNLNISGGTINASATEIHGGITNVSGNAIINVNDYAEFAGDSELNMSGGQLNLSKGITVVSLPDEKTGGSALFNMTGGEINMSQSYLGSSKIEGTSTTERQAGTSKLWGGTINVKDGKNVFLMDNPEVNNTINIKVVLSADPKSGKNESNVERPKRIVDPNKPRELGVSISKSSNGKLWEVIRVESHSPAEEAGLLVGDQVLSINNLAFWDEEDLSRIIKNAPTEKPITFKIKRDSKILFKKVD